VRRRGGRWEVGFLRDFLFFFFSLSLLSDLSFFGGLEGFLEAKIVM
jgi:hypothetical protein